MWGDVTIQAMLAEVEYRRQQAVHDRGPGNVRRRPVRGHRGLRVGHRST